MRKPREPRTQVRLPVSIGRRAAALTADISRNGFSLETPGGPLPAGSEMSGYVLHGERELGFRGEIVWSRSAHPQLSPWSRMGVRFSWVSPGLRALLSIEQKRRR